MMKVFKEPDSYITRVLKRSITRMNPSSWEDSKEPTPPGPEPVEVIPFNADGTQYFKGVVVDPDARPAGNDSEGVPYSDTIKYPTVVSALNAYLATLEYVEPDNQAVLVSVYNQMDNPGAYMDFILSNNMDVYLLNCGGAVYVSGPMPGLFDDAGWYEVTNEQTVVGPITTKKAVGLNDPAGSQLYKTKEISPAFASINGIVLGGVEGEAPLNV